MLTLGSGEFDFTMNQYLTRKNYLPYVVFSQPSKPGKLLVVTTNERKVAAQSVGQALKMDQVFSDEAIILVIGFGLLCMVAIAIITKIQGIHFTMYNAWDLIYGWVDDLRMGSMFKAIVLYWYSIVLAKFY